MYCSRHSFLFLVLLYLSTTGAVVASTKKQQQHDAGETDWSTLQNLLSKEATIHDIASSNGKDNNIYSSSCETTSLGSNAYAISAAGNGICMHSHDCAYEFCQPETTEFDLPSITIDVRDENDISTVLQFVNDNNLVSSLPSLSSADGDNDGTIGSQSGYSSVSIKTSGHSYQGSSMSKDSILIWMYHFKKDGNITTNYENSCGDTHDVVGIGGGETFDDVLEAVKGDYHIVTGGGRTVAAAGGWLQGGGLSFSSRKYGIGADNVIDYRVVLANGTIMTADACTNSDLFWALRGGGGGTYGVVTHVHYKVHPVTPIIALDFGIYGVDKLIPEDYESFGAIANQWFEYWITTSPVLDNNWCGGFFSLRHAHLLYCGTMKEAKVSFLSSFEKWYYFDLNKSGIKPGIWGTYLTKTTYDNWYEYKGGAEAKGNPSMTDPTGAAYAGVTEMYARLMPVNYVTSQPKEVLELFFDTINSSLGSLNYFLGGNINAKSNNETAVHPALRNSVWNVVTFGDVDSEKVRSFIPNNVTGICYNHHNVLEPDWRNASWGVNYGRLGEIKDKYDPDHIFNCWHCVGYNGAERPEIPSSAPSETPTKGPTSVVKENPLSRFLLKFSEDDQQQKNPVTKSCKWLSEKSVRARRVCTGRRYQIYLPESNLGAASQTCPVTCAPYCATELKNTKFLFDAIENEDGKMNYITRQCRWLGKQTDSRVAEVCANIVNFDSVYGQASQVCTVTCGSCA